MILYVAMGLRPCALSPLGLLLARSFRRRHVGGFELAERVVYDRAEIRRGCVGHRLGDGGAPRQGLMRIAQALKHPSLSIPKAGLLVRAVLAKERHIRKRQTTCGAGVPPASPAAETAAPQGRAA